MEWFNKIKKWQYNRDGVLEDVKLEAWVWAVQYQDETELHQFDHNGVFHQIGEVDQDKVRMMSIYKPSDPSKRVDVFVTKGMKLIYKYKQLHPEYFEDLSETVTIYLFGYRSGKAPHYTYHYNFILPDDRMVVSDTEVVDLPNFRITRRIN